MTISRVRIGGGTLWITTTSDAESAVLPVSLAQLLAMPLAEARTIVEGAGDSLPDGSIEYLTPVDEQEVWAAGVTYRRSRDGRMEESTEATIYDRVYSAARPEVFFKSTAARVVGDGADVGIRADSAWNVPEPELAVVANSGGELFGYLVGNDMSSRTIEGENPLYLPQAKVYDRACALSSEIVPVWDVPDAPFAIAVSISRGGAEVFAGSTSTSLLTRPPSELITWLMLAQSFPAGAVLLTGTGIVPDASFTLEAGDTVAISIDGIGSLQNPVVVVGSPAPSGT